MRYMIDTHVSNDKAIAILRETQDRYISAALAAWMSKSYDRAEMYEHLALMIAQEIEEIEGGRFA